MNDEITKMLNLTPASNEKEKTEADVMPITKSSILWSLLKNTDLNLFGLSNQKICDYCDVVIADPNKLYLKLKPSKKTATAVVSALHNALHPKYVVELVDHFYVISESEV